MRVAITGAASGIGLATAQLLKSRGASLTLFDIAPPPEALGVYVPVDLSDAASIARAAAACGGPFDALLNIAGLPTRQGLEAKVVAVNFVGMRAFTLAMLDRLAPGGSIVILASRAGHRWQENIAQVKRLLALRDCAEAADFAAREKLDAIRAYDLTKEAAIVWSKAMTEPLFSRQLRINTISPGAIETRILEDFLTAFGERATVNIKRAGRPGRPDEIAEIAAFLASPQSAWLKGCDIAPDGGISAFVTADQLDLAPSVAPDLRPGPES